MTRSTLIQLLSAAVADLLTGLGDLDGLTDADVADLLVPHLDRALTWESAPPEWRVALEALDGPTLRLLVLGALKVGRHLPGAMERARDRMEEARGRRAERREERHA